MAWAARLASTWLLEKVKERRFVKGQTHEETCKASGKWNVKEVGSSKVSIRWSQVCKAQPTDREVFAGRRVGVERRPNIRLLPVFRKEPESWWSDQTCGTL